MLCSPGTHALACALIGIGTPEAQPRMLPNTAASRQKAALESGCVSAPQHVIISILAIGKLRESTRAHGPQGLIIAAAAEAEHLSYEHNNPPVP